MAKRKIELEQAFARNAVELADRYLELLALRVEVERAELKPPKPPASASDRALGTRQSERRDRRSRSIRRSLVLLAMMVSITGTPLSLAGSRFRSFGQHARSPLRRQAPYPAGVLAS